MGCEMLELKPELFQQQQEEGGDRQRQPSENVRDEQHKLTGLQVAEGKRARSNPLGELRSGPAK